jgi:phosphoglycerate dehydrogenase-like enzyme
MGQDLSLAETPCRIVVIGSRTSPWLSELANLPSEAKIVAWGESLDELQASGKAYTEANVLFCSSGTAATLGPLIKAMPYLEWVHCLFAGVDHILCKEMQEHPELVVTNAKGVFSSSLAEYVMFACGFFTKDCKRLLLNKQNCNYDRFTMGEIKGKTMGIIGYGDIGQTCAKLAKAYGCRVIGMRRTPALSASDEYVDKIVGTTSEELLYVLSESDYLVVCAALTKETQGMIGGAQFIHCKKGQVLINIGRGALLDEEALCAALQSGILFGAALDVFTVEPLPQDSPLWKLPNVLISPHNADMTATFRHDSTRLFNALVSDYVEAGYSAAKLCNKVDVFKGY